ncbi:glycerol-3-phosphate dehydrogenase [Alsobacter soli]|uniref:Glycerol-3-phosphate dehydrogenase n=1 Tax=Alsobacter soli TaxID=2109933 RepID=A0A2T1HYD5_9HYPH|nr:glycerol-3-phosphate dehydrogenase [Alsobacter soli]
MTGVGATGDIFDLAIIGGGVNGAGIARDAAGRGASVVLFEQNDLASATSSASTKLIHGGLRYLEYYEFRLVREALAEREVVWGMAPHIVWPLRFVLPHHAGLRPSWMLRLGLFLYDHLGGRRLLPATRSLDLRRDQAGAPLKAAFARGFEYSDCWVEDARLVVLNARDAAERGAAIRTRTKVVSAAREGELWKVETLSASGERQVIRARALVNAAGPWVAQVANATLGGQSPASVRLVQGSHIVVPRIFDGPQCYIFQNADNRIVFAIPYEQDFTLIGTTDRDFKGDPSAVAASEEEIQYLCAAAGEYFKAPIRREDVVWTYSGVRPLYDDGATKAQEATRDYVLKLDAPEGAAPILSVFGGKITTFRRLAEAALAKLAPHLPTLDKPSWTGGTPLPGGDFDRLGFDSLVDNLRRRYPWIAAEHARRLARAYGTRAERILAGARSLAELGETFGADLTAREVEYLMDQEWAVEPADILWRRSKLGLRLDASQQAALAAFMAERAGVSRMAPRSAATA